MRNRREPDDEPVEDEDPRSENFLRALSELEAAVMVRQILREASENVAARVVHKIVATRWFEVEQLAVGFYLRALADQIVIVDGSTNLLHWVPVRTNAIDVLPILFSDPESESHGMRFYRLRLQQ